MNQNESYSKIYKNIDDFCEFIQIVKEPKVFINHLEFKRHICCGWEALIIPIFKSKDLNKLFCLMNRRYDEWLFCSSTDVLSYFKDSEDKLTYPEDELVGEYMNKLHLKIGYDSYVSDDDIKIYVLRKLYENKIDVKEIVKEFILLTILEFIGDLPSDFFSIMTNRFPDLKDELPTSIYLSINKKQQYIRIKSYDFENKIVYYELIHSMWWNNRTVFELNGFRFSRWNYEFVIDSIAPNVFDGFDKVEEIVLPNSLTTLKANFWGCTKLTYIKCKSDNYKDIDGVLYSRDLKNLIAYPSNHGNFYDIPEGVECIKKDAFKGCKTIEIIRLPNSLKLIETNAFYRCHNLKIIICDMPKSQCEIRGNYGSYGPLKLKYYYEENI